MLPDPIITDFADTCNDGKTFQRSMYIDGDNSSYVALIKVNGGKHEWHYATQNDIDYATEIYNFFVNKLPAETKKNNLLIDFKPI